MKSVEIMTCNSTYKDGECIGGYHEIHKINYLQNSNHLITSIDSIIKNNLLYCCDNTVLECVTVYCDDLKVVDEVNKHYNGFCGNIKVYVEYTYV